MANVKDVANFFIDIAQQRADCSAGDLMTNLRLQKLLYFAQGWHLARYGKPLFDAPLQAWAYGPVVPEVYQKYRENGKQGITTNERTSSSVFTQQEYDLLLDVAREYDKYATGTLVEMSHDPNGPWKKAHSQRASSLIPLEDIRTYFAGKEPLLSVDELLDCIPVEKA